MSTFMNVLRNLIIERPGRKHEYAGWSRELAQAGEKLVVRFGNSAESEKNLQKLGHIIGIERWSQARLRVALGDPFIADEHDAYVPDPATDWNTLQQQFVKTRADTVTLAEELASNTIATTTTIHHNQFDDVTTRGWLRYMFMHANLESKAIK